MPCSSRSRNCGEIGVGAVYSPRDVWGADCWKRQTVIASGPNASMHPALPGLEWPWWRLAIPEWCHALSRISRSRLFEPELSNDTRDGRAGKGIRATKPLERIYWTGYETESGNSLTMITKWSSPISCRLFGMPVVRLRSTSVLLCYLYSHPPRPCSIKPKSIGAAVTS